ncbi:MAG: hypothetical protein J6K17_04425 [Oscillospiraceae bacterium]|nr:hypothetical protein [Oscillospiraceae bacterium]
MNLKRILVAAVTCAAVSLTSVIAYAESIGSASIYLADETWSNQVYWGSGLNSKDTIGIASVTPVEITGDGTYTTSVKFKEAMDYGFFFCLSSDIKGTGKNTFADYPDAEISIESVKADGKEITGNSNIAAVNDDGFMRVSIFDPLNDASENYAYSLDWTSGIKSMEVTFTVTGTGVLSAEAPEEDKQDKPADVTPEDVVDDNGKTEADNEASADEKNESDSAASDDEGSETDTPVSDDKNSESDNATTDDKKTEADKPASDDKETESDSTTTGNEQTDSDENIPDSEQDVGESAPADDNTEAPNTGNAPISPMAATAAVAGLVAFLTKKKK